RPSQLPHIHYAGDTECLYSLPIPTNPPYHHRNAGSWQRSPSIRTPPRDSGRSAKRLCPYRRDVGLAPAKVPCPCHCVNLLVGFILAFHPAIQIVAAGTGKQHDGDLCYWSWQQPHHGLYAGVS
ncbi:hypothetical protein EDB89DRAFT_2232226, partial [Lactarius sanguifluus]